MHDARRALVGDREGDRPRGPVAVDREVVLGEAGVEGADVAGVVEVHPAVARAAGPTRGAGSARHPRGEGVLGPPEIGDQAVDAGSSPSSASTRLVTRRSRSAAASVCGSGSAPKVQRHRQRPFGMPRIRSAIRLRWICEVPAAIVYWNDQR